MLLISSHEEFSLGELSMPKQGHFRDFKQMLPHLLPLSISAQSERGFPIKALIIFIIVAKAQL